MLPFIPVWGARITAYSAASTPHSASRAFGVALLLAVHQDVGIEDMEYVLETLGSFIELKRK